MADKASFSPPEDKMDLRRAAVIWENMYEQARVSLQEGNHKAQDRLVTLERVKEACDNILSGEALTMAGTLKESSVRYRGRVATPESIHSYCTALRKYPGPHFVTIRKNSDLLAYIEARNQEGKTHHKPARPSNHQKEVEKALLRLGGDDRDLLWKEVESGRKAKAELNALLHFVSGLPSVNVDGLPSGKITVDSLKQASAGLDQKSQSTLKAMISRLTDNRGALRAFDLVFRLGRLKMDYGSGTALILPEEMNLLFQLANVEPPKDEEDDFAVG